MADERIAGRTSRSVIRFTRPWVARPWAGCTGHGHRLLLRRNRHLRQAERELSRQGCCCSPRSTIAATASRPSTARAAWSRSTGISSTSSTSRRSWRTAGVSLAEFHELDRAPAAMQALADPVGWEPATDCASRRLKVGAAQSRGLPQRMPDGGFVVSSLDITRRLQAETIVRQAQKMEAVGRLTGGVAHDFNNLLQVIGSNLDLLAANCPARRGRAPAGATPGRCRARRSPHRPAAGIRASPASRSARPQSRPGGARDDRPAAADPGRAIAVEAVVAGGLWNTLADPSQVENAIFNLAINARDAMAEHGGKLTIEVANASPRRRLCRGAYRGHGGPVRAAGRQRHGHRHDARKSWRRCSSRSSPPSRKAREPGSGCPRSTASSSRAAGTSSSTASSVTERR